VSRFLLIWYPFHYCYLYGSSSILHCRVIETCLTGSNCFLGECRRGPACHFVHDPDRVAVCKAFLAKGTCIHGSDCNLSHDLTSNRVPLCFHYARGNCMNGSSCRYPHVDVSPTAPVCHDFALLGYCDFGEDCQNRHVYECPDYSSTRKCDNPKCRLSHVDRARQIRQFSQDEHEYGFKNKLDDNLPAESSTFTQEVNYLPLEENDEGIYETRLLNDR
jgi:hypothetical protein